MNQSEKVLKLALSVGSRVLQCGGEISRTEETFRRICRAYGAADVQVFSITGLIMGQVVMPDGSKSTGFLRVSSTGFDFGWLEELNEFSRSICSGRPSPESALESSVIVCCRYRTPEAMRRFGGALAAAAFAVLFGGGWVDAVIGAATGYFLTALDSVTRLSRFAHILLSSMGAGCIALLFAVLGIINSADAVITATIMLMIPGFSFCTAIREMLGGDIVAGSLRMLQSLIVTLAMACGYAAASAIFEI